MPKQLRAEDLSFIDRAPLVITEETTVAATPDEVWPALADATAWTEWFAGMKQARYTSPEPHGVGSTRTVVVKGLRADEELLAFDEGERFAFRVVSVNMPGLAAMVEVVTLEAVDGGTRVVYRQAIELRAGFALLTGLVRSQMQRGLVAGLAGLGRWVDARP